MLQERERDADVTTNVKCGVASYLSWSISLWNPKCILTFVLMGEAMLMVKLGFENCMA